MSKKNKPKTDITGMTRDLADIVELDVLEAVQEMAPKVVESAQVTGMPSWLTIKAALVQRSEKEGGGWHWVTTGVPHCPIMKTPRAVEFDSESKQLQLFKPKPETVDPGEQPESEVAMIDPGVNGDDDDSPGQDDLISDEERTGLLGSPEPAEIAGDKL